MKIEKAFGLGCVRLKECLGNMAVKFLVKLYNRVLDGRDMPQQQRSAIELLLKIKETQ